MLILIIFWRWFMMVMMVMIVMMILTITVIRVLTRSSDKTKSSILLSSCPAYHANLCIANLFTCIVNYYYFGPILLPCYFYTLYIAYHVSTICSAFQARLCHWRGLVHQMRLWPPPPSTDPPSSPSKLPSTRSVPSIREPRDPLLLSERVQEIDLGYS